MRRIVLWEQHPGGVAYIRPYNNTRYVVYKYDPHLREGPCPALPFALHRAFAISNRLAG